MTLTAMIAPASSQSFDALQELGNAFRRGATAYALGCSITASYAGCFGEGCLGSPTGDETKWFGPLGKQYQPRGFLSAMMRNISVTVTGNGNGPHAGRLFNRGMGGSIGNNEVACLRTFIPPHQADVVFLDFFFGHASTEVALQKLRVLLMHLRGGVYGPRPPFVVILLNRWWCLTNDGEDPMDAHTRINGEQTLFWPNKTWAFCRNQARGATDDSEKFQKARARIEGETTDVKAAILRSFSQHCGGVAVLSVAEEVIPLLLSRKLSVSQVAPDGIHPARPPLPEHHPSFAEAFEQQALTAAWTRVLTRWAAGVLTGERPADETRHRNVRCRWSMAKYAGADSGATCFGADYFMPKPQILEMKGFEWIAMKANDVSAPKPGWVSREAAASLTLLIDHGLTGIDSDHPQRLSVDLHFLHTYTKRNAGTALIACSGSCACQPATHSTFWKFTWSSDQSKQISPIEVFNMSACKLTITSMTRDHVKLRGLRVAIEQKNAPQSLAFLGR